MISKRNKKYDKTVKIFEKIEYFIFFKKYNIKTIKYEKNIAKEGDIIKQSSKKFRLFGIIKNKLLENRIKNRRAQKCGNSF